MPDQGTGGLSGRPWPVLFQPPLVEEVVLRAIVRHPEERAFRRERDTLYVLGDIDERECAFQHCHLSWFEHLGLAEPIHAALAEVPILAQTCTRCVVSRSMTRQDEGADLLVAADSAERTVLIRLRVAAFDDRAALLSSLRAELLHVADMVDPAFGYEPTLPAMDGGPSYEKLVRERYRVLWDATVVGRLVRRGVADAAARDHVHAVFAAAFPMLGTAVDSTFERFFSGAACTHSDLMAVAVSPRALDSSRGLSPGGRCPLCRFPTYAPEPAPQQLATDVVALIAADFPDWRPAAGLCNQCAELYRSRPLSMAAAAHLPRSSAGG